MKTFALTLLLASLFRPDLTKDPVTLVCNSGGTATTTLPAGTYEVLVSGGTASTCYAETCPVPEGEVRTPGNHGLVLIQRPTPVSCRSDLATVQWVPGTRL